MAIPRRDAACGLERLDVPALELGFAAVGRLHAGDRLDQRRLARAVVAEQADDLAGADLEVDVLQRLHGAEALAVALQREERFRERGGSSAR